ncbi:hypothetical protein [Absidia glauca]|uniref:Uncharacterized protein n=1 Tax=Absidia glauca TaxID=4829 RepID=A0A168L1I5_ABSGL|nr:hypothetical protein [Absidia glauca]
MTQHTQHNYPSLTSPSSSHVRQYDWSPARYTSTTLATPMAAGPINKRMEWYTPLWPNELAASTLTTTALYGNLHMRLSLLPL